MPGAKVDLAEAFSPSIYREVNFPGLSGNLRVERLSNFAQQECARGVKITHSRHIERLIGNRQQKDDGGRCRRAARRAARQKLRSLCLRQYTSLCVCVCLGMGRNVKGRSRSNRSVAPPPACVCLYRQNARANADRRVTYRRNALGAQPRVSQRSPT
jgi:hypothetical protein